MTLDFITNARWDACETRQEKRCFRQYGKSYSRGSIGAAANKHVVDVRDSGVLCDWESAKKAMREKANSICNERA